MKKIILLYSLLLTIILKGQTQVPLYTWMGGTSNFGVYGAYGTKGVASTTNTAHGKNGACMWADNNGNLWVFGGFRTSSNYYNDLMKYNPSTGEWTWISGVTTTNALGTYGTKGISSATTCPGARAYANYWTDSNGNFWLFGGKGYASTGGIGNLNDLWKFDVTTGQWTWMSGANTINSGVAWGTMGVPSTTNIPYPRSYSCSWSDNSGNLWLYGGFSDYLTRYNGDLWKYNTATNEWTWVSGSSSINAGGVFGTKGTPATSNFPGARASHMAFKDASGNLWLFGGQNPTGGSFNDLWRFNPATNEWTWMTGSSGVNAVGVYGTKGVEATTNVPGCRTYANCWSLNDELYMEGGYGYYSSALIGYLNDIWKYNVTTNKWVWLGGIDGRNASNVFGTRGVTAVSNSFGGRPEVACTRDNTGKFWLFGGNMFNDVWKLEFCNAPTAINTTTASLLLCGGNTTTLTAGGVGNLGWYTAATGGTFLTSGGVYVTPTLTSTTTYYVQDSTCAPGNRTALTVSVNPIPPLAISNLTVCENGSVTLTASGANTYTWSTGANTPTLLTYPAGNETYTLSGTYTATGCSNTIVKTLTVIPLPTLSVSPNATICSGQNVQLSATGNATSYAWSTGQSSASITVAPVTTTNYSVSASALGCISRSVVNVFVNLSPAMSISPATTTMCAWGVMTLTASGAPTFSWNSGATTNTLLISPTSNTSYTVIGTAVNGCTNAAVKNISTLVSPTVSITGNSVTCAGSQVTLTGAGATTYTWNTGSNASFIMPSPTVTTTYSLTGKNANVCTRTTTFEVIVNPLPNVQVITTDNILCIGNTVTLTANGADSYTWSTTENTSDIVVSPTVSTTYTVTGIDANSCSKITVFTQSVSLCTGVENLSDDTNYLVYPNPTNGMVNVEVDSKMDYIIMNVLGEETIKGEFISGKNYVDLSSITNGVYFLQLKQNQQMKIIRIVKQ